jgi:Arc/MetJ-type ribon-helix-helix transcriptional regulator
MYSIIHQVMIVKVNKSVSIDLKSLVKIQEKIDNGESENLSEFIQKAIKNELKNEIPGHQNDVGHIRPSGNTNDKNF